MIEIHLVVAPLVIGAIAGLYIAAYVAARPTFPGSRALIALALAAAVWSMGYALEVLVLPQSATLFWAKMQYFGIVIVPVAWYAFASRYEGPSTGNSRLGWRQWILLVIPLVTLILVWTNELHGLIWTQVAVRDLGAVHVLAVQHGPWFWVFLVYSYCLMLFGSVLLIKRLFNSIHLYRWQIGLVLIAALIPWLGNLIYLSPVNITAGLDWTPLTFVVACVLLGVSLLRYHLGDILPVARQSVFASIADAVLVLGGEERIADMNRAAEQLVGVSKAAALGQRLSQILPEAVQSSMSAVTDREFRCEIAKEYAGDEHFLEMSVSPLMGFYPVPIGSLVVLHDITQHKRAQASLEEARLLLEQTVAERTETLSETVKRLEYELLQRTLAEQNLRTSIDTYRALFEGAGDAIALADLNGKILRVNRKACELLDYKEEGLLALRMRDIVVPEELEDLDLKVGALLGSETIPPYLRHYRKRDGGIIPVEVNLVLVRDQDGQPQYLQGVIRDVSERVRAEEEQSRLMEELKQSAEELRQLTYRLQEVQESERRQLAAELHDSVGQNLTGLSLNLKIIDVQLGADATSQLHRRLDDSLGLLEQTTRQVRDVLSDLHSPLLEKYGLVSAVSWYAQQFSERSGIQVMVQGQEFTPRLPIPTETILFRLVQEAMNNVLKHAHAAHATIRLESDAKGGCVTVEDDGKGFEPLARGRPGEVPSWGRLTMQQRAISLGGDLTIDSSPGGGTRVSVRFAR